jgi:uncharacterized protein YkwD
MEPPRRRSRARRSRPPEPVPRTLVQAAAFLFGLWLALLLWPGRADAASAEPAPPAPFAALEATFHEQVNGFRSSQHLITLRRLPEIDRVARAHSEDMAQRHYLSHVSPEGRNPVDRLRDGGVSGFSLAAENAGMTSRGNPNSEIFQGWLHSPVHRRNLVAPPFNATGIGIARAADGTFYYTQLYITLPR